MSHIFTICHKKSPFALCVLVRSTEKIFADLVYKRELGNDCNQLDDKSRHRL